MKLITQFLLLSTTSIMLSHGETKAGHQTGSKSEKIDRILEAEYKKREIVANPIIDEATFLRRAYLSIIGRIPTTVEAKAFFNSKEENKRRALIDSLVDSEGFKGQIFLFYSELLRLKTNMEQHGTAFHKFLYDAAHTNLPYDKLVFELLASEGHVAENPAVSYYLRDSGMLLDNVSGSVQVFLGTQIGCAQCHDHPFDDTTQMDYYKLASFSGGLAYYGSQSAKDILVKVAKSEADSKGGNFDEELEKMRKSKKKKDSDLTNQLVKKYASGANPVFKYYNRNEMNDRKWKELQLPHDYQYNDAKPGEKVAPDVLFGNMPEIKGKEGRKVAFAEWVTSSENPRFTKVIANRLWAHVFGRGLVEPLDDWSDETKIPLDEVLNFVSNEMKSNEFDMKETLRVLYYTDLFQRAASNKEASSSSSYDFAGPLLKRMKAQQLFDSMLTLEIGDEIEKKNTAVNKLWDTYVKNYQTVKGMSPQDVLDLGEKVRARERFVEVKKREVQKLKLAKVKAEKENRLEKVKELSKQITQMYKNMNDLKVSQMMSSTMQSEGMQEADSNGENDLVKYALNRTLRVNKGDRYRSSERPQPAKSGSFVREFGATDGEISNNSHSHASIPQALSLLNGKQVNVVTDKNGVLPNLLKDAKTSEEKLDVLFLAIYSRYPSEEEKELYLDYIDEKKKLKVFAKAMINSKSFLFIQ